MIRVSPICSDGMAFSCKLRRRLRVQLDEMHECEAKILIGVVSLAGQMPDFAASSESLRGV